MIPKFRKLSNILNTHAITRRHIFLVSSKSSAIHHGTLLSSRFSSPTCTALGYRTAIPSSSRFLRPFPGYGWQQQSNYNVHQNPSIDRTVSWERFMACAATAISATLLVTHESNNPSTTKSGQHSTTHCCGIAAVIGKPGSKQDARGFLVEGLTVLKNRGYDSAGIATIDVANTVDGTSGGNRLAITKYASNGDLADGIELVKEHSHSSTGHYIGIAHTR